jgi:hypothetical protein
MRGSTASFSTEAGCGEGDDIASPKDEEEGTMVEKKVYQQGRRV